jgi:hypothetical protein
MYVPVLSGREMMFARVPAVTIHTPLGEFTLTVQKMFFVLTVLLMGGGAGCAG